MGIMGKTKKKKQPLRKGLFKVYIISDCRKTFFYKIT